MLDNKYKLELDVQEPYLTFIKTGQKKIEGRLGKDKYLNLKPGDLIKINNIEVEIIKVTKYPNFKNMLITEGVKNVIPNSKNLKSAIDVYYKFYSKEEEQTFGVVGINIKVLNNNE
ncbi:MAG: ASCH domain-containing protein [Candidatus Shapirobacteria bacterium]